MIAFTNRLLGILSWLLKMPNMLWNIKINHDHKKQTLWMFRIFMFLIKSYSINWTSCISSKPLRNSKKKSNIFIFLFFPLFYLFNRNDHLLCSIIGTCSYSIMFNDHLDNVIMLDVIMFNVIMLNVIMLDVIMFNVKMLNVIMLNIIMLIRSCLI